MMVKLISLYPGEKNNWLLHQQQSFSVLSSVVPPAPWFPMRILPISMCELGQWQKDFEVFLQLQRVRAGLGVELGGWSACIAGSCGFFLFPASHKS